MMSVSHLASKVLDGGRVSADEVAAFRKALNAGIRGEDALAAANKGKDPGEAARYTLLTGFEDTEMADNGSTDLSGTQYGQLR